MTRRTVWLIVAVSVLAVAGAGAAWWLTRQHSRTLPQISASSDRQSVIVGPYLYCNVVNLDDCERDGAQATLKVDDRDPVQLSVPAEISKAPWRLLTVYEDERNSTTTNYRPDAQHAVTIPTADPTRGKVVGIAVQLVTLVQDEKGELHDVPHAEWSVKLTRG